MKSRPEKGEAPTAATGRASMNTPSKSNLQENSVIDSTQATTLIPVFTGTMANNTVQLCDARTLHTFMQVRRDFTTWIKGRIRKFGFTLGEDYLLEIGSPDLVNQTRGGNKKETTDYHLTLDMAKELSMVENNEQGRAARRYFIQCERRAQATLHNPAIDYSRVSPAQKQDLREIVQSIVDAGIQKHGETWARFQKKFRVNKYEELPASLYEEARRYLISKLPMGYEGQTVNMTATIALSDPERMKLAFSTACEASAQVQRTVFNAMMQGDTEEWQHSRYLLNLNYDSQGRPTLPHAQPIATDQMVVSFSSLPQRIADGEIMNATDAQLATLATACTQRLTQRAQHREKQVTLPVYPSNSPGQRRASAPSLPAKQPPAPDEGLLRMTFK